MLLLAMVMLAGMMTMASLLIHYQLKRSGEPAGNDTGLVLPSGVNITLNTKGLPWRNQVTNVSW
jgi:hypothetical protein